MTNVAKARRLYNQLREELSPRSSINRLLDMVEAGEITGDDIPCLFEGLKLSSVRAVAYALCPSRTVSTDDCLFIRRIVGLELVKWSDIPITQAEFSRREKLIYRGEINTHLRLLKRFNDEYRFNEICRLIEEGPLDWTSFSFTHEDLERLVCRETTSMDMLPTMQAGGAIIIEAAPGQ